jgi:glycosyltransferase involved in cell wall biosynthesis
MESGGAERQVTYLAKGFMQLGHEVHVALIMRGANYDRLAESGATVHMVSIYPKVFRFLVPLLELFRNIRPEVVYLWQRPFDVLGGIAARICSVPAIHAERTDPAKVRIGPKVWLRNVVVPWSKAILVNSDAGSSYWLQRAGMAHVVKLPNIIPFDELRQVEPSIQSKGCVITVGRLDRNKNLIVLLEAVHLLRLKGIYCKVIVVGSGSESGYLGNYVKDHELSSQVRFFGHRNDVWSLLKGSKCFVSLSYSEGEPNAVLEAAALGCPLIVSNIPSHRSLEGLCSMTFVEPESPQEVAAALISLLSEEREEVETPNSNDHSASQWIRRSSESVCRQTLAVFAQANAK